MGRDGKYKVNVVFRTAYRQDGATVFDDLVVQVFMEPGPEIFADRRLPHLSSPGRVVQETVILILHKIDHLDGIFHEGMVRFSPAGKPFVAPEVVI